VVLRDTKCEKEPASHFIRSRKGLLEKGLMTRVLRKAYSESHLLLRRTSGFLRKGIRLVRKQSGLS